MCIKGNGWSPPPPSQDGSFKLRQSAVASKGRPYQPATRVGQLGTRFPKCTNPIRGGAVTQQGHSGVQLLHQARLRRRTMCEPWRVSAAVQSKHGLCRRASPVRYSKYLPRERIRGRVVFCGPKAYEATATRGHRPQTTGRFSPKLKKQSCRQRLTIEP